MKFILLFGPQAVGKMTVGFELEKATGYKLFHNHMTIDLVSRYFDYGTKEGERLVHTLREAVFREVAHSDLPGFIFTYVWAFDQQEDHDYVKKVCAIFEEAGAEIYFVELEADVDERLARNRHPFRLAQKPTKQNLEWSDHNLLTSMEQYRLQSLPGEIKHRPYVRINTTHRTPAETVALILESFNF
ncbi:hypothetical protein A374_16503 [Fictibacillus macauensis ZFHKF-1]|uniref:Shikimate kinase n=1 Tax=Fictibacillus macauensis ZFHKF-1 TaxID=1196324 RepID=I8AF18_9BACL|nr:AAA family ATPase [Fictibacillus macauensis]EIT84222.1 hypothetical protein A374_16503 [Fictibacillus macauensis ZFHKF-1]